MMGQGRSATQFRDFEVRRAIEAQLGEMRGTACNDAAVEAVADATIISTTRSEMTAEDSTFPQLLVCRHGNSPSQHGDVKSSTAVKASHGIDEQEIERFLHKTFGRAPCLTESYVTGKSRAGPTCP
jgi:hypothetical protein